MAWVLGYVFDNVTRLSIHNATITFTGGAGSIVANSGMDGHYIKPNMPVATYSIEVTAAGYHTKSESGLIMQAGATFEKNINLSPIVFAAKPVFDPAPGSFAGSIPPVTIECATDGAVIRYTLDNSAPTESSNGIDYSVPIDLTSNTTIKARAFADGMEPSELASGSYTIESSHGDVNGDSYINLKDAILGLQIMIGMLQENPVSMSADVDGDDTIGLVDIIYILQKIADLR